MPRRERPLDACDGHFLEHAAGSDNRARNARNPPYRQLNEAMPSGHPAKLAAACSSDCTEAPPAGPNS
jgi:hypothetical protein